MLIRARMPHASIGSDVIVGFPGETDAHAATLVDYLERVAAHARARLSVLASSGHRGERVRRRAAAGRSCSSARRGGARASSERLSRGFRAAQVGTVRRALVVDDGTAAVTDNYLRLRLDRLRVAAIEWIDVEVRATGPSGRRVRTEACAGLAEPPEP